MSHHMAIVSHCEGLSCCDKSGLYEQIAGLVQIQLVDAQRVVFCFPISGQGLSWDRAAA